MKRILAILIFLAALTLPALATTVYVAQTAGSVTCNGGTHTAIAPSSITWTAGNTYFLCGTFSYSPGTSAAITVGASGTSGNPIVVQFDTVAILTATYWSTAAIAVGTNSYVTINGATNGTIQATANGTGLANQVDNGGCVTMGVGNHRIVENLTCSNLYVRTCGTPLSTCTDENGSNTTGILDINGSNDTIQNNTVHDIHWGIDYTANDGLTHAGLAITGNTVYNIDHGIIPNVGNTDSATITGSVSASTTIHAFQSWDDQADNFHHDGIHVYDFTGGTFNGIVLYNNTITGNWGFHTNTGIYLESNDGQGGVIENCTAFNNIIAPGTGTQTVANGAIASFTNFGCQFYNNTLIGWGIIEGYDASPGATFENNLVVGSGSTVPQVMGDGHGGLIAVSDYNAYAVLPTAASGNGFVSSGGGCCINFTAWQAIPFDTHAVASSPAGSGSTAFLNFNATTFVPNSGSPLISAGSHLRSPCRGQANPGLGALCSDAAANVRPTSGAWDAGAYNAPASTPTIASFTVGATRGNTVPQYAVGMAQPSTDYTWLIRSQNCGGSGQPLCTVNTPLVNLMGTWNQHSRKVYHRFEGDPMPPYLWTCYNKPVGAAIIGNATSTNTWTSDGAGNATLNLPSAAIFTSAGAAPAPTNGTFAPQTSGSYASVYIDGFGSSAATAAGLNNPSTPAHITTAYTITSSTATSITITGLPVTGTPESGTEDGYLVPAPQYYPNAATCSTGTLFPPAQAIVDTDASLAAALPNYVFSVSDDLSAPQLVNGHFFGAMQGDGTNAGNDIPTPQSYAVHTIPQWVTAFSTAGASAQLYRIEHGNEPDNYPSQGLANYSLARTSNYGYTTSVLTNAKVSVLQPGSGQSPSGVSTVSCTDGASVKVTITGGVCTAVSVNAGGSVAWGAAPPVCTVSLGGTPCVILTQSESWAGDYADIQNELKNDSITQPAPSLDPSTAGNGYHAGLLGGTGTTIGSPPTVPSLVYFATPGTGLTGFGDEGQHSYPYGKNNVCPNYPLSSISRVNAGTFTGTATWSSSSTNDTITMISGSGYAYGQGISGTNIPSGTIVMNVSGTTLTLSQYTTGSGSATTVTFTPLATTTVVTAQPTNFQTLITSTTASYVTADAMSFTVQDADTITSYSFVNGIAGINSVGTLNTASTPTLSAGNYITINGTSVDSTTAGANLYITAVGSNSYTVSGGPFFSDGNSSSCASGCFDQLTVLSGSIATTVGFGTNLSLNITGGRVASTLPKVHPYVITFTNTTGAFSPGTDTSGGTLTMTALESQNITNTPAQTDGWNLDLQPGPGCPHIASGNQYVYPPSNYPGNAFPYCGTSTGYNSANFNEIGTPSTITFSNPTTATFVQQGPTDSASSGMLTLVTATVASPYTSPNVPKNPNCVSPDLLTSPLSADIAVELNAAHSLEGKYLEVGTGTGYGALSSPLPFRMSETNSMSPAEGGISDTIHQALWWIRHQATGLTFNGYNGNLLATGHSAPSGSPNIAFSGFDGENPFTGQSNAYEFWTMKTSPPAVSGVVTNYTQDVTSQTAAPVSAFFYGNLIISDWLGTGCTGSGGGCSAATSFINCSAVTSNIPGVYCAGIDR